SAPNGHEIKFTIQISDASGDCWGSSLKLVVAMPHIIFSRQTPREAKGNGDDRVDPGEQWLLSVELQNTGLREAAQLGGSLRSLSPVIRVLDSLATFREVRVGSTTENLEDPFVVEVSTSGQRFEIVPLELHLRETGGFYEAVISFYLAIGQGRVLLVEDDGTADFRKHYADAVNRLGLATRHWDTALEGSVPLDTLRKYSRVVWYVGTDYGNSLFRQGTDNVEAYLAEGGRLFLNGPAAVFVLRSRPLFTQYLRSSYINYNTGLHRLTTGGQNEVLGEIAFWLSQEGPNKQGMPTEIEVADPAFPILFYDRDTPEGNGNIRSRGIGASAVATGNYRAVYFAFGWEGIQDPDVRREVLARVLMWLQGEISGVPGGETCLPTDLALEANYPNPFNASTTIVFRVAEKAYARLAVYDARGRLVRTLLEAELPPGRHRILFDAKDERGASLSSGVYLCRLEVGDKQVVRKMVLTK
ncbi:MAG: T9SS type A sorting domain-containing protein, partial [candidate division KSB1 bacterium]|nr:T9SS type A sorting domain-containing protein [candidate division KSB1 bacterium]